MATFNSALQRLQVTLAGWLQPRCHGDHSAAAATGAGCDAIKCNEFIKVITKYTFSKKIHFYYKNTQTLSLYFSLILFITVQEYRSNCQAKQSIVYFLVSANVLRQRIAKKINTNNPIKKTFYSQRQT